jgi:hypothetical protein
VSLRQRSSFNVNEKSEADGANPFGSDDVSGNVAAGLYLPLLVDGQRELRFLSLKSANYREGSFWISSTGWARLASARTIILSTKTNPRRAMEYGHDLRLHHRRRRFGWIGLS